MLSDVFEMVPGIWYVNLWRDDVIQATAGPFRGRGGAQEYAAKNRWPQTPDHQKTVWPSTSGSAKEW